MKKYIFYPFPNLEANEYQLRKLKISDINEIFLTRSDDRILKYLDIPKAKRKEEALDFIEKVNSGIKENKWIYWGIVEKQKNKIIGTICLWNLMEKPRKADIGFVLLPEYQGKGIMQKIIPKVIEFGFEKMKLDIIAGEVSPQNIKSIKLMEKSGFRYDHKLKQCDVYLLTKD